MADVKEREGFLLLVTVGQEYRADRARLVRLVREVEAAYMGSYETAGRSLFHAALIGPYDFAIVYTGSHESTMYLVTEIYNKLEGQAEILVMPWVNLDLFYEQTEMTVRGKSKTKKASR